MFLNSASQLGPVLKHTTGIPRNTTRRNKIRRNAIRRNTVRGTQKHSTQQKHNTQKKCCIPSTQHRSRWRSVRISVLLLCLLGVKFPFPPLLYLQRYFGMDLIFHYCSCSPVPLRSSSLFIMLLNDPREVVTCGRWFLFMLSLWLTDSPTSSARPWVGICCWCSTLLFVTELGTLRLLITLWVLTTYVGRRMAPRRGTL
ncbi:hypothetical protein BC826DRAFT_563637 [Russula brevipes]|nr:hypothetical protein BC826DRAFT_563637 [Russula brevipes]